MDGLFDASRRHRAPKWLVEQLKDLPEDRQLSWTGENKIRSVSTPEHIPSSDSDVPDFVQG